MIEIIPPEPLAVEPTPAQIRESMHFLNGTTPETPKPPVTAQDLAVATGRTAILGKPHVF